MAKKQLLVLLGTCLLLSGCCGVGKNATRTLLVEMLDFPRRADGILARKSYSSWADCAWQDVLASSPDLACSDEYQHGFKDGYVDYLYAGGTGEPPAVPPRCYWNLDYRTPAGHQAVTDWFAGFRHGARVAADKGCRRVTTIPSSLRQPELQQPGQDEMHLPMADNVEVVNGDEVGPDFHAEQVHRPAAVAPPPSGQDAQEEPPKEERPGRIAPPRPELLEPSIESIEFVIPFPSVPAT